ncbi:MULTISPECIES: sulfurtransferase-like selenium metabolism protein YedF [Fusobacterium]|uniref:sulfurtransferase-like selenium metabolism protein YedF n=1 Tax=Fusobacterium TaxID=848 RepID=UPI001476E2E1|nr:MULTISPECIES: sulfurtransferase-like selenium metabolism protein YedF [Fusobacterium]NME35294.1 sulfurtransferase-like selenium metabolism protein YedF [Fusobacterium sp. FSA-380-WT-3A]
MVKVNAVGFLCPIPVIMTKKALNEIEEGEVEILVDNETAKENLEKLGKELGFAYKSEKVDENYKVVITKIKVEEKQEKIKEENIVVIIDSDEMGKGDKELGEILVKGFVYSLTEMEVLPKTVILYNKGVYLATVNKNTIEDLKKLENMGVEVIACGTCVNYYGLQDKLQVGSLTNMYTIIDRQFKATKIIRV